MIEVNQNFWNDLERDLQEPFVDVLAASAAALFDNISRGERSGEWYEGNPAQSSAKDGSEYSQQQSGGMRETVDFRVLAGLHGEVGLFDAPDYALEQELGRDDMIGRENVLNTAMAQETANRELEALRASQ
jgi:hypothetical protein